MTGTLDGIRVIELAGIGPGPFGGMLLADQGADVITIDRPGGGNALDTSSRVLARGRRSIVLDLKEPGDHAVALALIDSADVVIDPFRPGVAERLGVGPEVCRDRNPRLIYARMTGWGKDGPLAERAGHDINYLAISGVLGLMGDPGTPPPVPLNLVADFGGGGMLLGYGVLAALFERERSGLGQIVDAAMLDGVVQLAASLFQLHADGLWNAGRGTNFLQGGTPWYRTYRTSDGEYVSVGALEPQFYRVLLHGLGIDPDDHDQWDRDGWPALTRIIADLFAARPLAHWVELLADTDACFAPVLRFDQLADHPHHRARETIETHDGVTQPAPSPRFSRTPARYRPPPARPGEHTDEILAELGMTRSATSSTDTQS
jgi:alpha-methylacyl-CoA racemase